MEPTSSAEQNRRSQQRRMRPRGPGSRRKTRARHYQGQEKDAYRGGGRISRRRTHIEEEDAYRGGGRIPRRRTHIAEEDAYRGGGRIPRRRMHIEEEQVVC